jgi:hypothetical protein
MLERGLSFHLLKPSRRAISFNSTTFFFCNSSKEYLDDTWGDFERDLDLDRLGDTWGDFERDLDLDRLGDTWGDFERDLDLDRLADTWGGFERDLDLDRLGDTWGGFERGLCDTWGDFNGVVSSESDDSDSVSVCSPAFFATISSHSCFLVLDFPFRCKGSIPQFSANLTMSGFFNLELFSHVFKSMSHMSFIKY